MKKGQVAKKTYVNSETEVFTVKMNGHLLNASTSGGHHSAEDDETLNAKRANFFGEEDGVSAGKGSWED